MKANIYGRHLPIDQQEVAGCSCCVTCEHPHYDTIHHLYVRCAMCDCQNVGKNDIEMAP